MNKNGIALYVLSALIGFSSLVAMDGGAPTLFKLDANKIYTHKDAIIKELKRNYFIKLGIYGTAAGLAGYGIYRFFSPIAQTVVQGATAGAVGATASAPVTMKACPITSNEQRLMDLINEQSKRLEKYDTNLVNAVANYEIIFKNNPEFAKAFEVKSPSFCSQVKDYFVFTLKSSVVMSVASLLLSTVSPFTKYLRLLDKGMDSLIDRIFYHEDLNWYLATHTTLFDVLAQTEKHMQVLAEQKEPAGDFQYHYTGFVDSCNLSLQQLESVLGFMMYKVGGLEKKSPINGKRAYNLAERFFNHINEEVEHMQVLLTQIPLEISARQRLKIKFAEMRSFIQESLHAFVAIEFVSNV